MPRHQGISSVQVENGSTAQITTAGKGALLFGYIHIAGSTASEAALAKGSATSNTIVVTDTLGAAS